MAKSDNLRKAKEAKNDEFYTRLEDIENEISCHPDYVRQFQGKTVLCNCDDPEWSNFFTFFKLHFKQLGLKKLICTHYEADGSPSYALTWEGEMLNDDMLNLITIPLKGNGDFRSDECIEFLKEADIVVTNPPFSMFRVFVQLLIKYGKDFVIIGNKNAIAYKEFFPLLKDGKCFVGYNAGNGTMSFATNHSDNSIGPITHSVPSYWYTSLDLDKSHEPLPLNKNFYGNECRYPKYDNYDAIEVSKVKEIPKDYFESWGVSPDMYALLDPSEWVIVSRDYDIASIVRYWIIPAPNTPLRDIMNNSPDYPEIISKAIDEAVYRNGQIGVPVTYLSNHCDEQFEIMGSSLGLAEDIRKHIDPGDTYEKGGPTFYLPAEDNSQSLNVEREREREREKASQATVQQNRRQTQNVMYRSGIIGVPITFVSTHCATQFQMISLAASHGVIPKHIPNESPYLKGQWVYSRILIKRNIELA